MAAPCAKASSTVARELAQAIVRDGEGATKFITIRVVGGSQRRSRVQAWWPTPIGHSPLVKTAFFASDPNLGRILAAVGYAGIADLDQSLIDLYLDDVHVAEGGGRRPSLPRGRRQARHEAKRDHSFASICTGARPTKTQIWTCDSQLSTT